MDLLEELRRIVEKLDSEGIDYALCGGLAMAIYGMPRATLDVDILIEPTVMFRARRAVGDLGFTLEGSPMEFNGGEVQIYRLCKIDPVSTEALALDLLIVTPKIQSVWDGRLKVQWEGGTLSVVSPEGLIALKSLRGSGQDRDDVDYLRSITDED